MPSDVQRAHLALLLEVASTPTPGNVDRRRDLGSLRFEHFLAGAVGALPGLRSTSNGASLGQAFEEAVAGMAAQRGGNTQFGALLLLVPLVRAARTDRLDPDGLQSVVEATTVSDAAAFYRSFEHVSVAVDDVPASIDLPDVREGASAVPALEAAGTTLEAVMAASATVDDVAREWARGFPRSFEAADRIERADGNPLERGAAAHLALLADRPDTFVAKRHGMDTAERVTETARSLRAAGDGLDPGAVEAFADDLVESGINPGTTADILAAGFFVALERGFRV